MEEVLSVGSWGLAMGVWGLGLRVWWPGLRVLGPQGVSGATRLCVWIIGLVWSRVPHNRWLKLVRVKVA